MTTKIKEQTCTACNGTGFPTVKPMLATHKIYPVKCEAGAGKGRITDTTGLGGLTSALFSNDADGDVE